MNVSAFSSLYKKSDEYLIHFLNKNKSLAVLSDATSRVNAIVLTVWAGKEQICVCSSARALYTKSPDLQTQDFAVKHLAVICITLCKRIKETSL